MKSRKPRVACINCGKKYCTEENSVCKGCELKLRIESLDLEVERQRIINHYEKHDVAKSGHGHGRMNKKKYQLFIITRNIGKNGFTWFARGDVSLGYPQIGRRYNRKTRNFEPDIEIHTYSFHFSDLGNHGKFLVGSCIIEGDVIQWLESNYEKLAKEALQKQCTLHQESCDTAQKEKNQANIGG